MKRAIVIVGGVLGVVMLLLGGGFFWASRVAAAKRAAHYETHRVEFPIPFPLASDEVAALRVERAAAAKPPTVAGAAPEVAAAPPPDPLAGVDLKAAANERAVVRGKHLIESRYACTACHGADLGGGTMVDAPPIGSIFGVNITSGKGGVVAGYRASDWDRIVRHGVKTDGLPAMMPSEDFFQMSDHELSDIVAYITSVPPVDREMARPRLGPVGTVLVALGKLPLSAENKADHQASHAAEPPPTAVSLEFGQHLVSICMGCHSQTLAGGPIPGGDPSWPHAANLTQHPQGLAGWTYDDFVRALREGKRKDGTALRKPMSDMTKYGANCTETELKAMWAYVQSVPPRPTPK